MKKLLMFIAMAVFCTAGFAKTADEVINEIKAATNAQVISFDKEMLKLQFKGNDDIPKEFFDSVDEGMVLVLDGVPSDKMKLFNDKVAGLQADNSYEQIASVFDNESRVKILGKKDNDIIKELLIIVSDGGDGVFIKLSGNLKPEDLGKIVNEKTININ